MYMHLILGHPTSLNIYYWTKNKIDPNKVVEGDFNTPLSPTDRSSRQKKVNKETMELKDVTDLMDMTDVYRYLYTTYILLSSPWNLLQKRPYLRSQS
jgi:hypothetical protein